jgi:hypothetical protein
LPEQHKKKKLWEVDPSIFEPGRKASFFERRILPPLRQIGKFGLYALAITYPIYLVYVGLAYGGLAFWSFFAGSVMVMGVTITKLGYASNFRHWDIGMKRTVGVILGFAVAASFYAGLVYARILFVPVALGLIAVGVFILWKQSGP